MVDPGKEGVRIPLPRCNYQTIKDRYPEDDVFDGVERVNWYINEKERDLSLKHN